MKKLLFLIVTLFAAVQLQAAESPFTLPAVKQWKEGKGVCVVGQGVNVRALQPELAYAADYLRQSLAISAPAGSDAPVVELVCSGRKKDAEAYTIVVRKDRITIKGDTPQAVLWGVQTLIQWSAQSPEIPCGTATDRPDYALRGMMIDVGRKYIPLDYLRHLVDVMSYYKMNCLQVHLNDNGFKKYFHQNWDETYAAFRIESELFPELTARDGYYSKRDFRNFILESARKGVEIIPEIDAPAHALAFTHFRPSLGCEEFGVDHFDLTNPAVVPFLDSLWTEYIGGPEPVFAGPRVHIGTDEYSNKKQDVVELFRSLTDHLIKFCQQHGKQPVVWGSLTYAKGDTPVQVDGV
ncbi:MAG: family 20 glycosylhydrolase, partial [Bacteroidaceae bacterium]|nr:family 20 glycosylhydrolase [Bacteroidaceae bacterium]